MTKAERFVFLSFLIIAAALIRFYNIGTVSLWNDELETYRINNFSSFSEAYSKEISQDVHPPAFQALVYYTEYYCGKSEFWLRFPALLFGLLNIVLAFRLGKKIYGDREGLLAAIMMSFLWIPVYYSREARMYTMLICFSILSVINLLSIIKSINSRERIKVYSSIFYFISAGLLTQTHFYGLFLVFLEGLYCLYIVIRRPKYWLPVFLPFLLLFLINFPALHHIQTLNSREVVWFKKPEFYDFGILLYSFSDYSLYVFIPFILSLIVLIINKIRGKDKYFTELNTLIYDRELFLFLWIFVPYIIVFIKSDISLPVLNHRFLLISYPAYLLLFSRGIALAFPTRKVNKYLMYFASIIFIAYLFCGSYFMTPYREKSVIVGRSFTIPHKEQADKVVGYLVAKTHVDGIKPIFAAAYYTDYIDYYLNKYSYAGKADAVVKTLADTTVIYPKAGQSFYLINLHFDIDSLLQKAIEKYYYLQEYKQFSGAGFREYIRK